MTTAKEIIALLYLPFQFACMGLFARYLATDFTVLQQVYLRVLIGGVFAVLLFRHSLYINKLKTISRREWLVVFVRSIFNYLLAVALFSAAVLHAKIGTVSFINALPFVALYGVVFFKEKLTTIKAGLILLALMGVFLVVANPQDLLHWGFGEVLAILSSAFFALGFVSRRWHSKNMLNDYEITVLIFAVSFLILLFVSLVIGEGLPTGGWSPKTLGVVTLAGLANTLGLWLANYAFSRVENILAGNLLMLEVVFGIMLGYIFYRETYSSKELFGGLMIAGAAIGMNYITAPKRKAQPPDNIATPGETII